MSHKLDYWITWSLVSALSRKVLVALGSGSLLKEVYHWGWVLKLYSLSSPLCSVCGQIWDLFIPTTILSLIIAMPSFPWWTLFFWKHQSKWFISSLRCFVSIFCLGNRKLINIVSIGRQSCSQTHGSPPSATTQCALIT